MEFNPGKSVTWNCSYCEEKGLQKVRNCDGVLDGQCPQHGTIKYEDLEANETTGRLMCPTCGTNVEMPFKLNLGKVFWIWRCPLQEINHEAIFFVKLVGWSEAIHQTPSGRSLLEESNLYFEIREFVLQEQNSARKELEEQRPSKDLRRSDQRQGSRPRIPKRTSRRR